MKALLGRQAMPPSPAAPQAPPCSFINPECTQALEQVCWGLLTAPWRKRPQASVEPVLSIHGRLHIYLYVYFCEGGRGTHVKTKIHFVKATVLVSAAWL